MLDRGGILLAAEQKARLKVWKLANRPVSPEILLAAEQKARLKVRNPFYSLRFFPILLAAEHVDVGVESALGSSFGPLLVFSYADFH